MQAYTIHAGVTFDYYDYFSNKCAFKWARFSWEILYTHRNEEIGVSVAAILTFTMFLEIPQKRLIKSVYMLLCCCVRSFTADPV